MSIERFYAPLVLLGKTETKGTNGRTIQTWKTITAFDGLINQRQADEALPNGIAETVDTYNLYCGADVAITEYNRVQDGDTTYRVISAPKDTVARSHHYKILLARVGREDGV